MTLTKTNSNYQDFLKTLAIIAMIIDHLGLYLFPEMTIMRVIGRISMPIFCFFVGYNFHNKPKSKILILGILLFIVTTPLLKIYEEPNILISIYLGQWYLYFFHSKLKNFFYEGYCHVVILAFLWIVSYPLFQYGTLAIAVIVLGYIAKHDIVNLKLTVLLSFILSLLHSFASGFGISVNYSIILITIVIIGYILMILKQFDTKIIVNLKPISRNAVYIYCIHLAIIQGMYAYLWW